MTDGHLDSTAVNSIVHIIPHLEELDLSFNQMNEDNIKTLCQNLTNAHNLTTLDLSCNIIGEIGMNHLACSLKSCVNLEYLRLDATHLNDEAAIVLAEVFCPDQKLIHF